MVAPVVFFKLDSRLVLSSWKASCGKLRDCFTRYTNPQLIAKCGQILCETTELWVMTEQQSQNLLLKANPLTSIRSNKFIAQGETLETVIELWLKLGWGRGTWDARTRGRGDVRFGDAGTWDAGTPGRQDSGTPGRRDVETWDAKTLGLGMWDVGTWRRDKQTDTQHLMFALNCKVQFSVLSRKVLSLFSARERAEFNKSCNLLGFWSGRNFLVWTALAGRIRLVDLFSWTK